jgi:hypothetical protein
LVGLLGLPPQFVGARKPEQVQQVHELIALVIVRLSCPLLSVCISSQPKTWEPGDSFNNNKSKKANADPLEQEPDAMSDVTIVALVFAIQAVF